MASRRAKIEEEFGDLLFVMANVARHLKLDPETALRGANDKFRRRFAHIEARLAEDGRTPADSDLSEMDALWDEAKARERELGAPLLDPELPGLELGQQTAAFFGGDADADAGFSVVVDGAFEDFGVFVQPGDELAFVGRQHQRQVGVVDTEAFVDGGQELVDALAGQWRKRRRGARRRSGLR